ncbi:protein-export chaperone SecB [Pseudoruegeria sp. SHC-113]|uniref:protein-export chaperone SecB n=1 Tax=Pseudoruegeria sp. SHC-113 TaxID=2855439 RepID=UPI0021BB63CB|nr:protein-export chaperone SecB [Pseudoruegeria sp. SHC-113]MCT8158585.1 protein-export chaperone SecB [Pseudoruegeria sp. SHC-113]
MAENGTEAPVQPEPVKMQVLAQYIRDMSFENVLAQKGAQGAPQPDVKVNVNLDAKKRSAENQYEVLTKFNISAVNKEGGDQLFLLELEYAGIFHVENVPEDQLHPYLLIECPRMLFPYIRRIVGDVTRDGGFPPLNLENIDFVAIYRQNLALRAAAAQKAQAEETTAN